MSKIIDWFTRNAIAANLLMVAILIGGLVGSLDLPKEVFPRQAQNFVDITMAYPGAGPREVEQQLAIRIEEAIAEVIGIRQITSESRQGLATVTAQLFEDTDVNQVLNDLKAQIDTINTFPASAERPVVRQRVFRTSLMYFALYGDVSEKILKQYAEQLTDDLAQLSGVSVVDVTGLRADEMAIEVSENTLRQYNLTFDQLADTLRQSSLNMPAGSIDTLGGDIQLQTRAQAYSEKDFENIVIQADNQGSELTLADIAHVRDDFAEHNLRVGFNDKRALAYAVYISDNQPDLLGATDQAREVIKETRAYLPENVDIEVTFETRSMFDDRLELLSSNAFMGLILVFMVLMLFLRPLLAIWVCVGIVIAFAGAIWLMPQVGVSLNMITMFAFLMVLGIVVDDAIIVGESIYAQQQKSIQTHKTLSYSERLSIASGGACRVGKPVIFAILSTGIFFAPMLGMPAELAYITHPIAIVVILCLIFSLVESLFILPAHLAHMKPESSQPSRWQLIREFNGARQWLDGKMQYVANHLYRPALNKMLGKSGATSIVFVLLFMLSMVIFNGLPKAFFPSIPNDFIAVNITLPEGTAFRETERITAKVAQAGRDLREDPKMIEINGPGKFLNQVTTTANENTVTAFMGLFGAETRNVSTDQLIERLRELIGPIPEAKEYSLAATFGPSNPDIQLNLNLAANDIASQARAVAAVDESLSRYQGVFNVRNSLDVGQVEVEIDIKPHAQSLGIRVADIARQLRQGFYGEEIQRIPRGREDVRVMLRYPKADRQSLDQLNKMRIRTLDGTDIPLEEVAEIKLVPGFTAIKRVDRRRNISITADVKPGVDANLIVQQVIDQNALQWAREFPGFKLAIDGNLRTEQESNQKLVLNMLLALGAVYAVMAIAFGSYFQPLLVLTAIPFGFMGAVFGHKLLGHEMSLMSQLGFLACAGVVINDNLVLLDRINHLQEQGKSIFESVLNAGRDRFRAIILTSLTTFIGLGPILFEQSVQAKFLIPMVISLSFGVLFATAVTLILVPCLYLTGIRWKQSIQRLLKQPITDISQPLIMKD